MIRKIRLVFVQVLLLLFLFSCSITTSDCFVEDIYAQVVSEGNPIKDYSPPNIYDKSDYIMIAQIASKVSVIKYQYIGYDAKKICVDVSNVILLKSTLMNEINKMSFTYCKFSSSLVKDISKRYKKGEFFIFAGLFGDDGYIPAYLNKIPVNYVYDYFPLEYYDPSKSLSEQTILNDYYQQFIDLKEI
ncbi:MAG: hypothetical protein LBM99_05925 [Bacillales bacterium]|jgi:hypothetical protein|nr:hypothetical protein [Bacillales bacterium]